QARDLRPRLPAAHPHPLRRRAEPPRAHRRDRRPRPRYDLALRASPGPGNARDDPRLSGGEPPRPRQQHRFRELTLPRLRPALALLALALPSVALAHAPHLTVAWLTVSGDTARAEVTVGLEHLAAAL